MTLSALQEPGKACRRKTKIVATIGPASRSTDVLKELITAGANVFRLNFSHGTYDEHLENLRNIRAASESVGIPVAVLQDLSGPKIRISPVDETALLLRDQDKVLLKGSDGKTLSDNRVIHVETLDPVKILKAGERVLLADGTMELLVDRVDGDSAECTVIKGGKLRSRVGIAFPDSEYQLPATTKKDFSDLAWGIANGVDFVAESFVSDVDDIVKLREKIIAAKADIPIIAKIERRKALENIDAIVGVADAIMVARGDLGVELPLEKVPVIQRELIRLSNRAGIPVIVATQMLSSMVTSIRPTRAEASDIATAVFSGTDAVMLSEETAIGERPAECVRYLGRIAMEAEKHISFEEFNLRLKDAERENVPESVAFAACAAAHKLNATAIITGTESGRSSRLVAKYRPQAPIYGASYRVEACRRMCLYWGVTPLLVPPADDLEKEICHALKTVCDIEEAPSGAPAIITTGQTMRKTGSTSMMTIRRFGEMCDSRSK